MPSAADYGAVAFFSFFRTLSKGGCGENVLADVFQQPVNPPPIRYRAMKSGAAGVQYQVVPGEMAVARTGCGGSHRTVSFSTRFITHAERYFNETYWDETLCTFTAMLS